MLKFIKRLFQTVKSWYVKDENGHTNRPAAIIFWGCVFLPLVIFEGIKVGMYDKYTPTSKIGLQVLMEGLTKSMHEINAMKERAGFGNKGFKPDYLALLLIAYFGIFAIMYIHAERMRNLSRKKDGDMAFGKIEAYNKKMACPVGEEGFEEPAEPTADDPGNMILSQKVRYSLAGTGFPNNTYSCALIVGSTGSGKSFNYVKPNIMQMNSSYVITDPKAELLRDTGKMLADNGYDVLVFNLKKGEQSFSCRYNPFAYIKNEQDVILAVDSFLDATAEKGTGGDPFFPIAEKNFYYALFFYVFSALPPEKRTLKAVYELYASANEQEVQKGKAPTESDFDKKFEAIAQKDPYNAALPFYNTFKKGSPKTKQSILISVGIKMWFLSVPETANLLSGDDLHFNTLAERKTALFVCIPTDSDSFKCLSAMLFSQLFQELYYQGETLNARTFLLKKGNYTAGRSSQFVEGIGEEEARIELEKRKEYFKNAKVYHETELAETNPELKKYLETPADSSSKIPPFPLYIVTDDLNKDRAHIYEKFRSKAAAEAYLDAGLNGEIVQVSGLAVRTRFILDEFYAIGKIQGFESKIATFRSLKMSADIIVQSLEQLKEMYEDKDGKVTGNCDLKVCLGVNTYEDAKSFSDLVGQTTVQSESRNIKNQGLTPTSDGGNLSDNAQMLVRPEWLLNKMAGDTCLIITRTMLPMKDKKYNSMNHPMWELTYNEHKKDKTEKNRYPFRRMYYIPQRREACIMTTIVPQDTAAALPLNSSAGVNVNAGENTGASDSFKERAIRHVARNITNKEELKRKMQEMHERMISEAKDSNKVEVNKDGDVPISSLTSKEKEALRKGLSSGRYKLDSTKKNHVVSTEFDTGDALSLLTDEMF